MPPRGLDWGKLMPCRNGCKHRKGIIRLTTCYGDPEGIRGDRFCPVCKTVWGCTKSRDYKMRIEDGLEALQETAKDYPAIKRYIPEYERRVQEERDKGNYHLYLILKEKFEPKKST